MTLIRRACGADEHLLKDLFIAYRQFYGCPSAEALTSEFVRTRLGKRDSIILLAFQDASPAGFVQLYPLLSTLRMARVAILNDLYVAEDCRRQGVGTALINEACLQAAQNGYSQVRLETEVTNKAAQSLYRLCGFTQEDQYCWFSRDIQLESNP